MKRVYLTFSAVLFLFLMLQARADVTSSIPSMAGDFTLPAPSSGGTQFKIWMTNYNRASAEITSSLSGVILRDPFGNGFKVDKDSTKLITISEYKFCAAALNSSIEIMTPSGQRTFATHGPIKVNSANCSKFYKAKPPSPSLINIFDHQSFLDVTKCAPYGLDARGHALIPYRSIAFNAHGPILKGDLLFIKDLVGLPLRASDGRQLTGANGRPLVHDGYVVAVDHVQSVASETKLPEDLHIDVFIGDQQDLLSEIPGDDISFRLVTAQVVENPSLRALLLNSSTCSFSK